MKAPKSVFVFLAIAVAVLQFPALGQEMQLSGTYQGNIKASNGENAFKLILNQDRERIEGTSQFFKADAVCRAPVPITGIVREDRVIELKTAGAVKGCERTLTLKALPNNQLAGELIGPQGKWQVNLEKK